MYNCLGTFRDPDADMITFKFFTSSLDYKTVGTFGRQASESKTYSYWPYTAVFFLREINLPPYKIYLTGAGRSPLSSRLTKSVNESLNLPSVALLSISLRYVAVKPSEPPAEPAENVLKVLITSSEDTCNG